MTAARAAADEALTRFLEASAMAAPVIRANAAATFTAALERVNGHLAAALDDLAEASRAGGLAASVRDGRPVLGCDSRAFSESPTAFRLASARSTLRDLLAELPDGLDG